VFFSEHSVQPLPLLPIQPLQQPH